MNWAQVRLLVTDFDGVHTDDAVYVDQDGRETVRCLRADGYGISRLKAAGIPVVVLSAEVNPVVYARCQKLDIVGYQGVTASKRAMLDPICERAGVELSEVCYMGNDLNDLECLQAVGFPVVVRNAEPALRKALPFPAAAHLAPEPFYLTERAGGYGAVREVCDRILEARHGQR